MILFCPDLTGKEEVKAMIIGNGDFVRTVLNPCIKERCVAYKDGKCMKYDNEVDVKMNREILFKAKRLDNGEWVEGYYRADKDLDIHYICGWNYYASENGLEREPFEEEINPDTLCQYTGLVDKNGKKIWENDIVRRTDLHVVSEPSVGFIEYDLENTSFLIHWTDKVEYSPTYHWKDRLEVIGNIFDNPDLLEV